MAKKLNPNNPKPGIYYGVSFEDYVTIDAVNNSTLKVLTDQSPAHAYHYMKEGRPETPALMFGSAVDCYILEPSLFAKKYVCGPDAHKNTKLWKNFCTEVAEGVTVLKPAEYEAVQEVYNVVSKSHAMRLLTGGVSQVVCIWEDEPTGLICKGRFDYLNENIPMITDLKTTQSADPERFAKDIFKFKYYQQAAFYIDGYIAAAQCDYDCCFSFFAAEKVPPYICSAFELGDKSIEAGRLTYRKALKLYKTCLENDDWPCYSDKITLIEMPDWALTAAGVGPHNIR